MHAAKAYLPDAEAHIGMGMPLPTACASRARVRRGMPFALEVCDHNTGIAPKASPAASTPVISALK
ncbi:hypothetical protein M7I_5200 [Glarea lozoyensis 74030]|uniref:Uncharacterized protein n=1 Tax=Glarea lozoyensis (strain ATCC 74030 / MF5533) TaxID=1104152 RepID=H0ER82_GLAL7|nr:hypothetical protein M7I_5200 [Glarea lozoyensis 74030]